MTDYTRGDYGRFGLKSDTPRKIRSVNLTDAAWEWLASTAKQEEMSRNDFLETLSQLQRYPFMEAAEETQEPVEDKVTPLMETVARLEKELAEVKREKEEIDKECDRLSVVAGDALNQIELLKEQIANQQPEPTTPLMETAILALELPEPAMLLNQLKGKHPKSKISLKEIEAILSLLEDKLVM